MDEKTGRGTVEWLGVSYTTILDGSATGGTMSIVDSESPPGMGPPRHIHDREDETFVVLTGACEFWLAGEQFVRRAGEAAFIPRGTEHTFRVVGEKPSRHLLILSPGGFERFFVETAQGSYRVPEDMSQVSESAARHGLRFTGPPLGAE